jgi:hypothetical protein
MSNANLTEWEQSVVDRGMKLKKPEFNPATDGADLQKFIDEGMIAKEQIELLNGSLADIRTAAKENLGIKPALFNKILNMHFKRNRDEVENDNEELLEIYDQTFAKKSSQD